MLRHSMSHGVQFDFNYTYGKSIDMGSDAERIGDLGGPGGPDLQRLEPPVAACISTFDTTHQLNSNWLVELPFGRGRAFGSNARPCRGWSAGRMATDRSFPLDQWVPCELGNGAAWATNWDLSGFATRIGPQPKTQTTILDGTPNLFKTPATRHHFLPAGLSGRSRGTQYPSRSRIFRRGYGAGQDL